MGYLMGAPIAGYLLQAGLHGMAQEQAGIKPYQPAIFYAGGIALVSSLFVLVARLGVTREFARKV